MTISQARAMCDNDCDCDFDTIMNRLFAALLGPSADALHSHQCPKCEFVWTHKLADVHDNMDEAHTCPSCHEGHQTYKTDHCYHDHAYP